MLLHIPFDMARGLKSIRITSNQMCFKKWFDLCRAMYFMIEYCRNFISAHERCMWIVYAPHVHIYLTYCQRKMWMFQSTLSVRTDNMGGRRSRKKYELVCAHSLNNTTNNKCCDDSLSNKANLSRLSSLNSWLYSAAQKTLQIFPHFLLSHAHRHEQNTKAAKTRWILRRFISRLKWIFIDFNLRWINNNTFT